MRLRACGFALCVLFFSALSAAQTKAIVTFAHLKDLEYIGNFYDGGAGPNLGLQFTANAQAIISASQGGSGNFINNPGKYPVMFFQTGQNVTMTATDGVQTGLWFYYSALQSGLATVYSGPNGTGNILASVTLTPNNSGCTGYKLCVWSPVAVPLSATAGSISFAGVPDYLAIGAMHLGYALPTSTGLTSSQNPSVHGEPVAFTATVIAVGTTAVGNVTFKAGNQVVGVVPTVGGIASITLSLLKTGSTHINAKFQGTGFGNSAAGLLQVVN